MLSFKGFKRLIERLIDILFYFWFTLEKVESLVSNDSNDICAVGKHLCGGATDLSLRCLLGVENSGEGRYFKSFPFMLPFRKVFFHQQLNLIKYQQQFE